MFLLGKTLEKNSIALCLRLESILGKFLAVGFLKRLGMDIRIFIVFCFLKKKSSRYLETKKGQFRIQEKGVFASGWHSHTDAKALGSLG